MQLAEALKAAVKPFLVVNPRSADGATGRHFDAIAAGVRGAVGEHTHGFTERQTHATELTREAIRRGSRLVVAVGGDGTINEVVNGFFEELRPGEAPRPIASEASLAIVARGTGGDFRRTLGLGGDLQDSCARLRAGTARPIDLGRVDYTKLDGTPGSRLFVNVSGAGVGARIVTISNQGTKMLGGKLTFMLASLRGLAGWSDVPVRSSIDGGALEELRITSFSVANGRYFGGGMMVAPEAKLDDGLFHLTIWSGFGFGTFVLKQGRLYDGSHVKLAGTRTRTARQVRLEPGTPDTEVLVEADGEQLGRLPAAFEILPGALSLVS